MKLTLNRNKTQLMCNAYANVTGNYLIQPMFISPKGQKATPYPCTTAKDPSGVQIVDENGAVFSTDYVDTINSSSMPVCTN